jgi:CubicO group peptidase (beta-lactamase class C family)
MPLLRYSYIAIICLLFSSGCQTDDYVAIPPHNLSADYLEIGNDNTAFQTPSPTEFANRVKNKTTVAPTFDQSTLINPSVEEPKMEVSEQSPVARDTPKQSATYVKHEKIAPPDFIKKTGYDSFDKHITDQLSKIVADNFDTLPEKMGVSVSVFSGSQLWSDTRGYSRQSVKLTTDVPIGIMSTSKTFMSALVLQQIEAGMYTINDKMSDLLENHSLYAQLDQTLFPDSTVEQLLLMRGGHGDRDPNSELINDVVGKPEWHPTDYLTLTTQTGSNPNGFEYSNNSSVLLGLIAQFQSQNQLAKLYQENLFKPLSLQIGFRPATRIPEKMALPHANYSMYGGYGGFGDLTQLRPVGAPSWYEIDFFEQDGRLAWAGAGGFSTPENMAVWGYELYSSEGRALSAYSKKKLIDSIVEENISLAGVTQNYGYHIARRYHPMSDGTTLMTYGHPGGGGGYSSALMYSPKLDISISVLANSELGHVRGLCSAPYMATGLTCITYDILDMLNSDM